MTSPNVTTPELYFKLNRAMTLHADLKGLLDAWVTSGAVNLHISECILALVKAHDDTMIRATRGSLDPDLHASPTWTKLGREIERIYGIWLANSRPPTFPSAASSTTPIKKRKYDHQHPSRSTIVHPRRNQHGNAYIPNPNLDNPNRFPPGLYNSNHFSHPPDDEIVDLADDPDPAHQPVLPTEETPTAPAPLDQPVLPAGIPGVPDTRPRPAATPWTTLVTRNKETQQLALHPQLNDLVTRAFGRVASLHVTNVEYSNTAHRSVEYILHLLGHKNPTADTYPPYKAAHQAGQLVHAKAFMTHVRDANPTITFVDHGSTPTIGNILANDPARVGTHNNQTELKFPWLLEFSADVLPSERLINPEQASWTAFAVYIPTIFTLIPFNLNGCGYQLGSNLTTNLSQLRINRLLGGRIFPHPADPGNDKRKGVTLLRAFTVIPDPTPPSLPEDSTPDPGNSKPAAI